MAGKATCLNPPGIQTVILVHSKGLRCTTGCVVARTSGVMSNTPHPPANAATRVPKQKGHGRVNGIHMYYEIYGEGPPLVLIHGGGSTLFTSFGQMIPLLEGQRSLIAVELQAHGRSSDRPAPESFQQDADDVAALLQQLGVPRADVMGFSNGGSTGLQLASRHPALVRKLVAVSAVVKRNGLQPGFFEFMEKGTFHDLPQIYKDAFLSVTPDHNKLLNMYNKDRDRMLNFTDWPDADLQKIEAPVLLLLGDRDVVRVEHALEMLQWLQHARLCVVPGNHGDFIGEAMSPDAGKAAATALIVERFLNE